jgi:cytochrome P450
MKWIASLWRRALRWWKRLNARWGPIRKLAQGKLVDWLTSPETMREAFSLLRAYDPILVVNGRAIVAGHRDVREVLDRNDVFGVTEIYVAKMKATSGIFFLGMENTPQYQREVTLCRRALPASVVERARTLAREQASALMAAALPHGRLDTVGQLSRLVPLRIVAELFGVSGPNEQELAAWMRILFWEIFVNLAADADVTRRALLASAELNRYLVDLISERKAALATSTRDDLLTNLLRLQGDPATRLDDEDIRRNVAGVIIGAVDTISKTATLVLDQLLSQPEAMAQAAHAARTGDDQLLAAVVFEALRFRPHNPFVLRTCHQDFVLAEGTPRATTIPKGTTVVAATLSAMFDADVVSAPEEFRTDRPARDYLHFGGGMHTCFGERLNLVVVPEIIRAIVLRGDLRRAEGAEGQIVFEGPFPDRLLVRFDPG